MPAENLAQVHAGVFVLIGYLIWGHSLRDYPPGYPYGLVVEFNCYYRFRLEGKTTGGGSPGGLPLMLRFSRLQVANLAGPRLTSPLGRNPLPRHPSVLRSGRAMRYLPQDDTTLPGHLL
jgi:hypothetical protein